MTAIVEYTPDFWDDVKRKARDPVCEKQTKKKVKAIIKRPKRVGVQTVKPSFCRHVEVCSGRFVIFWEYNPKSDTVSFLAFKTHKKAFGFR